MSSYALPEALLNRVVGLRVLGEARAAVARQAKQRKRRQRLSEDGKLVILAADHPARRVTGALGNPLGLANRADYLGRIVEVLRSGHCDGLMATTDIVEELFLIQEAGGERFLDGKVVVGSMNRGGLAGVIFELDDRNTSFTVARIAELGLEGAKLMVRVADDDPACADTLDAMARTITELNARNLWSFLEALPVKREGAKVVVQKNAAALAQIAGVASALGDSSLMTWLKLPYCEGYNQVAAATTLPILLLGGEAAGNPQAALEEFRAGMRAGANVRGAMVGRNVLYPGDMPPAEMAHAVWDIVHAS